LAPFGDLAFFATCRVGIRVPKMSVRITETAERTKTHSTARKPSLIRVRVSSLIW